MSEKNVLLRDIRGYGTRVHDCHGPSCRRSQRPASLLRFGQRMQCVLRSDCGRRRFDNLNDGELMDFL